MQLPVDAGPAAVARGHDVGLSRGAAAARTEEGGLPYSRWLLAALGVVVLLGLARFGGGALLRVALPLLLLTAVVVAVLVIGRRNGRW